MTMRFRAALPVAIGILYLTACGGGSSGGSGPIPSTGGVSAGATPTATAGPTQPGASPTAPPSPGATASPSTSPSSGPTTAPPAPSPTATVVVNATSSPVILDDNPAIIRGNPSTFSAGGAAGSAPVDGVACTKALPALSQHFHDHLTLYVNGQQYAIPAAIGIYHPKRLFGLPNSNYAGWFNYDPNDPAACHYDIHVHAGDAVIHVESASATALYTLKQFLDIWGVTMSTSGFLQFTGPTRWFETNEFTYASGTHKVREITGVDPATIQLTPHMEFTVEVGTPAVNTPNYIFIDKNDL